MSWEIKQGDWLEVLRTMPDQSVHCVVTSPPYWGLRDYGVAGQLGLERTPEEYVAKMVEGFREVRRVLRDDGTCWINLGDSYAGSWGNYGGQNRGKGSQREITNGSQAPNPAYDGLEQWRPPASGKLAGLKPKDLCGIPWMVAFALRSDGWYLRQDIIWSKPNPMPESVRDRCTKAHEYIFLLSKSERYYYDPDSIRTPFSPETKELSFETMDYGRRDEHASGVKVPSNYKGSLPGRKDGPGQDRRSKNERSGQRTKADINSNWDKAECSGMLSGGANKRSVWTIATSPFPEAHFATFPPEIPETCIKAGCPEGGTVLDPFNGAGTTGLVATRLGRNYVGIELNPEYIKMAENRIVQDAPLFNG